MLARSTDAVAEQARFSEDLALAVLRRYADPARSNPKAPVKAARSMNELWSELVSSSSDGKLVLANVELPRAPCS